MILRPVRPESPWGPPMTKRPVGLMWYFVDASSIPFGKTGATMRRRTSRRRSSRETVSSCWVETTTASTRAGRPLRYSTVTWVFPSGRSQGISPLTRASTRRFTRRRDHHAGAGMRTSVSSQAKPNIIPWSPAPMSRLSEVWASTPSAMSGDWEWRNTSTRAVSALKRRAGSEYPTARIASRATRS